MTETAELRGRSVLPGMWLPAQLGRIGSKDLRRPLRLAAALAGASALAVIGLAALTLLGVVSLETAGFLGLGLAVLTLVLAVAVALAALALTEAVQREVLPRQGLTALPDAHFILDPSGALDYANPPAVALLPAGLTPIEGLRMAIMAEKQAEFERLRLEAVRGVPARATLPGLVAGKPVWLDIAAEPLPAGGTIWRVEDVSAAETVLRSLAADREDLAEIFDHAPVGLYALDDSGRFVTMNQVLAGWLGVTATSLTRERTHLQSLIWSDPLSPRPDFELMATAQSVELSLRGAGGVPVDIMLDQALRPSGGRQRVISTVRNLNAERRAGASRSSHERFRRFFELAPVGIALIDAQARFQETNRALDELLTDARERVLGRFLLDYIADEALPEVKARLASVSSGEPAGRPIETRLKGAASGRTVALFVSRLEAEDRTLAGIILHFIDLTDQKKLEAQFAQSQKMQAVGQLAGGVAHDFNNLLTAMIGFCDLLLLRFRPGDQSFADIMQIKQNANRAANLVRQLLAFSRQQTLQPRVIQIGEVLAELSHLLNRLLGENVELKMMHGRHLGAVRVDQGQLEQVIINLAVNARDAMPQGGTLAIRTANLETKEPIQRDLEIIPPGAFVLIEVTDDGTGIPREIIGRIFEPFFSTKEVGSGTGLGLSTVYGIVKQTGGFIFVDSEVGKGTRFSIYLPRHDETAAAAQARAAAESAEPRVPQDLTGAGVVLLVEDEDPVRMFSARALRNKGYTVLEAKSGDAALKIIAESAEPIDLIITDVVMPRMDGPALIKQVRETRPEMKVIFISGYTEDTFRKRLDNEQGIHFLPKPFSLKQLATKVKEIMTDSGPL